MNLSEIQLLQQKLAAMTESEFEDWLKELEYFYRETYAPEVEYD